MFVVRRWLESNLVRLGVSLVVIGFVLTVLGILSELHSFNALAREPTGRWGQLIIYLYSLGKISWSFGQTLIWAGVLLYCFGRFTASSFVTIVGFEQTRPSELIVRGPDADNIVWLGRHYATTTEAEAVANTFRQRFGIS
jgi:hypothetical protein